MTGAKAEHRGRTDFAERRVGGILRTQVNRNGAACLTAIDGRWSLLRTMRVPIGYRHAHMQVSRAFNEAEGRLGMRVKLGPYARFGMTGGFRI